MITIEDFKKVELKVAKVLSAERVESSEKLLKIEIDLGTEKRQIVSGIAKSYEPEKLVGKTIIVVTNLEPRVLFGLESNGMLLAAHKGDEPALLMPDQDVPAGSGIN